MDWLRRLGGTTPTTTAAGDAVSEPVERTTPGVAAVLDGVGEDGSHAVLDLGPASESSLHVYSRFARRIRFADLFADAARPEGWAAALRALPPQPERPYDLVFAWDVLDRIGSAERRRLVERLAEVSAPDARLYLAVDTTERAALRPLRFTLLDVDRMRYEATGPVQVARPRLLPAEVERLLMPFQVVRAFTSQVGLREYVAVRKGR